MRGSQRSSGFSVAVETILDCRLYDLGSRVAVLIVTYRCRNLASEDVTLSHERKEVRLFRIDQLDDLPMPAGYRASIRRSAHSSKLHRD